MTASNFMKARDILVAEMVRKRAELGYFDTQFIQYGASYWEAGEVRYVICDDDVRLYRQMHALRRQERYATPVIAFSKTLHVPEGRKEVYEGKLRAQNIKELRRRLPVEYFSILRDIPLEPCDAATAILAPIQEALVGRSHEVYLNILQGLVELARERYQLSYESYSDYLEWIERERALIISRTTKAGRFKTTFFGFVYGSDGTSPRLFATATESDMARKRETLRNQNVEMSPVFSQVYSYGNHGDLRSLRLQFMDMARQFLDADYMSTVKEIYNLRSPIPQEAIHEADAALNKEYLGDDVAIAWQFQRRRWGV